MALEGTVRLGEAIDLVREVMDEIRAREKRRKLGLAIYIMKKCYEEEDEPV